MESNNGLKYEVFKEECHKCKLCDDVGIRYKNSFPLFMQKAPVNTDILFVFEAPNWTDTFTPSKRFLTVGPDTDPSGKYFWKYFIECLGLGIDKYLFFTNCVLCLPRTSNNGDYSVTSRHIDNCSLWFRLMIDMFQPKIVCSVGEKAFKAAALIENHNKCKYKLTDVVAEYFPWYGRILYPLFHTGLQARYWRSEELQRSDWRKLRELYDKL